MAQWLSEAGRTVPPGHRVTGPLGLRMIPYEFDAERFSRWMAYVLRHNPSRYGLTPDRHGAVDLEAFLAIAARRYPQADAQRLRQLITESASARFAIEGNRLRARYGHSIPVEPAGEPVTPPAELYYGLDASQVPAALRDGLAPVERQMLHLSDTIEDAAAIIRRKSERPAIIRVAAAAAHASGVHFYHEGRVYLSSRIPPEHLAGAFTPQPAA